MKNSKWDLVIIIALKWGWLGFAGLMSVLSHIFQAPNEPMFTRGIVALVGFYILAQLESMDMKKGDK